MRRAPRGRRPATRPKRGVHWQFRTVDARVRFKHLYPTMKPEEVPSVPATLGRLLELASQDAGEWNWSEPWCFTGDSESESPVREAIVPPVLQAER